MALKFTASFVLDVDEWDELTPIDDYLETVLATLASRVRRSVGYSRGCDLYGVMPVYRADGARIGSYEMWNASDEDIAEVLDR